MSASYSFLGPGPFQAENIRPGDPYELSNGHAILCAPTGGRGGIAMLASGAALATDPAVDSAGADVGYAPEPNRLRAPDVAVGNVPNQPGWVRGAPPLAVEYADTGQDEAELQRKIDELLQSGTKLVWVVRLIGARRVEIYETRATAPRVVGEGSTLTAPGILKNPVPIAALFDKAAAFRATLRNLLQREGYEDLEDVKAHGRAEGKAEGMAEGKAEGMAEGKAEGMAEAILELLAIRGVQVDESTRAALLDCSDVAVLKRRLAKAARATNASEVIAPED